MTGTVSADSSSPTDWAIWSSVLTAFPGVTARSPQSTTDRRSNTFTRCAGLYGRRSVEALRIPSGPKRAPGR